MAKEKVKNYWHAIPIGGQVSKVAKKTTRAPEGPQIPKEVRVAMFVGLSGVLTAIYKQLESSELQNLLLMGVVNIVLVLLKERVPEIKKRLSK